LLSDPGATAVVDGLGNLVISAGEGEGAFDDPAAWV
jgi:hypothetical protein